ncbi:oxysterol-binding protein-related protein 4B-like isoform X1 [Magnolia sinica]|uniref:oxysterol-binding protein-related protein 4B-like isoform X1 n=1 Tax=Magnolia sinica TaxID=86752 RepID=UPI00265A06BD|nr:oxysterol-binding protein-related protein 4B-like isoform X1 [Magnolia sinica]
MDLKVWPTFGWVSLIFMCSPPSAPLPPIFNLPKSQLQLYGESVYCIGEDTLSRCANGKNALERFTSIVTWNITTAQPAIFGLALFNPVLGETHHVSRGSLNVLLEQVSIHEE